MRITQLLLVSAFGALLGCGPEPKSVPYAQLADGDALVTVNGVAYTKGELERDVGIRADLQRLSLEKADGAEVEALKAQFRSGALRQFVRRELLLGEARRRKVSLLPDDMRAYQETFARGLSAKVPVSFDAIGTVLGGRLTAFRDSLRKDALVSKVSHLLRKEASGLPMPTEEEAERAIAEAKASNAAFAVTNRAAYAMATNAWRSIVRGNDFGAVGRKLHEMDRYVTYIDVCDTRDPDAAGLKAGEVTPPLGQERGLAIFRANAAPGAKARFSCIFFALAPIYVIESVEETRKTLHEANVEEAFRAKLDALRQGSDVRFPFGENPFRE